jgi:hypothetical protein
MGLAITEPVEMGIKAAYRALPPPRSALSLPCFMHQWLLNREDRGNDFRMRYYTIRPQLLLGDANTNPDVLADCALAFDEEFLDTLVRDVRFEGAVTLQRVRGEEGIYQPLLLEWNNAAYIGSQYFIDVLVKSTGPVAGP